MSKTSQKAAKAASPKITFTVSGAHHLEDERLREFVQRCEERLLGVGSDFDVALEVHSRPTAGRSAE